MTPKSNVLFFCTFCLCLLSSGPAWAQSTRAQANVPDSRTDLTAKAMGGMNKILQKAGVQNTQASKDEVSRNLRIFATAMGVRGLLVREFTNLKGDLCSATIYVFNESSRRNTEGKIKCLGRDGRQTMMLNEVALD